MGFWLYANSVIPGSIAIEYPKSKVILDSDGNVIIDTAVNYCNCSSKLI